MAPPQVLPPPDALALAALSPVGEPSGPPGVGLDVSGGGYADCRTVYFFLDGTRVGSGKPDRSGFVRVEGLAVPGDTKPGTHLVTSSCNSSGRDVRGSAEFFVSDADVHRSALATSLADPDQVSWDLGRLFTSAALALAVILLFAFPYELFNSTVEENYDEIRGWFRRPARAVEAVSAASRNGAFVLLTVLASITIGFLSPDFGLNLTSLVVVVATSATLVVMSVAFCLPGDVAIHRRTGEWGKLNFLPGSVLVTIVMVALSRLLHFQPGYFYGALAGLAFSSALSKRVQGRVTAANWTFGLLLSLAAWFARMPVSDAAAQPDASIWWMGLEVFLTLTFLWGIEGLAVAMLPMRFLDGRKVIDWSRSVWVALLFAGLFVTVNVLLAPSSGYVGHTTGEVAIGVMVLFVIFGGISAGLWAYFRYRPERWRPKVSSGAGAEGR